MSVLQCWFPKVIDLHTCSSSKIRICTPTPLRSEKLLCPLSKISRQINMENSEFKDSHRWPTDGTVQVVWSCHSPSNSRKHGNVIPHDEHSTYLHIYTYVYVIEQYCGFISYYKFHMGMFWRLTTVEFACTVYFIEFLLHCMASLLRCPFLTWIPQDLADVRTYPPRTRRFFGFTGKKKSVEDVSFREKTRWWFQTCFFTHLFGILRNTFQMGWNHQPETLWWMNLRANRKSNKNMNKP